MIQPADGTQAIEHGHAFLRRKSAISRATGAHAAQLESEVARSAYSQPFKPRDRFRSRHGWRRAVAARDKLYPIIVISGEKRFGPRDRRIEFSLSIGANVDGRPGAIGHDVGSPAACNYADIDGDAGFGIGQRFQAKQTPHQGGDGVASFLRFDAGMGAMPARFDAQHDIALARSDNVAIFARAASSVSTASNSRAVSRISGIDVR